MTTDHPVTLGGAELSAPPRRGASRTWAWIGLLPFLVYVLLFSAHG